MKPDTAPRLSARNVSVIRGRRNIVDDATMALNAGELTILAGPNGAGKTTLARAMAGVLAFNGSVTFDGGDLTAMPPRARARALGLSAAGASISLADERAQHYRARPRAACRSVLAAIRSRPRRDPARDGGDGDRGFRHAHDHHVSGGERARVAMARALATEAPVLIADEPTASLDERHQLIVMELLQQIAIRVPRCSRSSTTSLWRCASPTAWC